MLMLAFMKGWTQLQQPQLTSSQVSANTQEFSLNQLVDDDGCYFNCSSQHDENKADLYAYFFKTEDLLERHLIPYLFSNIGYLTFYIDCIQVEKITLKIS